MPIIAAWMDLEIILLNEVNQAKTNIIWYSFYVKSEKNTNELNNNNKKNRLTHSSGKQTIATTGEKWGG